MRTIDTGTYAFDDEGVVVIIDSKLGNVIPRQLELEWDEAMWEPQEGFTPQRLVINLEFFDRDKLIFPETFDPPIKFQIYFTSVERAEAVKQPGRYPVAYWRNGKWNGIEVAEVYPVLSPSWAGYLEFEVSNWGDPTIALGS